MSASSPPPSPERESSPRKDLGHMGCGFLMGSVDVIPGVSGGTMALILGIYERLVEAISRVDGAFFGHLRRGKLRDAAAHIDLRFLVALFLGIVVALVTLASVMKYLLEEHETPTFGLFFGLIAGSSVLVAQMIRRWNAFTPIAAIVGAVIAYQLTGPSSGGTILPFDEGDVGEFAYVLICGMIAICAMILPGISGSYLLVLLGRYEWLLDTIRGLKDLDFDRERLLPFGAFGCGAVVGLLSFAKFLRWLLDRHHDVTMAVLGGFMVGSLRKLWPFKDVAEHNRLPHDVGEAWLPITLAVVGFAFVIGLSSVAKSRSGRQEAA